MVEINPLHLPRNAGQKIDRVARNANQESGRDAGLVGQHLGAAGHAHLAQVVGRQLESMRGKALLHRLQRGTVRPRLDPQQISHHIHRAIVLGRTQSPGHHDNRRALRQFLQSTLHGHGLVSHNPLLANLQARIEQVLGRKVALVLRISPRRTSSPMAKMAAVCGATEDGADARASRG